MSRVSTTRVGRCKLSLHFSTTACACGFHRNPPSLFSSLPLCRDLFSPNEKGETASPICDFLSWQVAWKGRVILPYFIACRPTPILWIICKISERKTKYIRGTRVYALSLRLLNKFDFVILPVVYANYLCTARRDLLRRCNDVVCTCPTYTLHPRLFYLGKICPWYIFGHN